MMRSAFCSLTLIVSVASTAIGATNAVCAAKAHTMHKVSVNRAATCVVSKTFEPQRFCLVDAQGQNIDGQEFVVTPGQPASFGMALSPVADFNMEYSLTCVAVDGQLAKSPKVIITIDADGPGHPIITITPLHGSKAYWQTSRQGGDFSIAL